MSKDNAYVTDILRAAQAIRRFVAGVTKADFLSNEEKYEAVNRKFEIIGEAARHLSPEAVKALANVPWRKIVAMRNILIHAYDDVDLEVVWDTAQQQLPPLIAALEAHLAASRPAGTEPIDPNVKT